MIDLRGYSREVVNLICTFYALRRFELPAVLLNLSESGVLLEIDYSNTAVKITRDYNNKWSKSERERYHMISTYTWNLN